MQNHWLLSKIINQNIETIYQSLYKHILTILHFRAMSENTIMSVCLIYENMRWLLEFVTDAGVSIENYKQRFHWPDYEIPMTTIVV